MTQNISPAPRWEAWPKNDRLKRWCVIDAAAPGRGKPVIADNIRTEKNARLIAAALTMRSFIESLTDAAGPYRYLDGTQIVTDARSLLAKAAPAHIKACSSPGVYCQKFGRAKRVKTGVDILADGFELPQAGGA